METCQTSTCDSSPIAICLHCQKYLCIEHLLQHNEQLICQANMYCDEFNELTDQIDRMSYDQQFTSAEEDLNDWLNDQMKELEKVYEQKLFQLKQAHKEVKEKVQHFQQNERTKSNDMHRLFNSKLNKQISLEQLNRMKNIVEQLHEDIHQFQTSHCSIILVNNDRLNYSYKPNIDIQFQKKISNENPTNDDDVDQECNKSPQSQLRADAKPFEYIPKEANSISTIRSKDFDSRLFDGCPLIGSINQTM